MKHKVPCTCGIEQIPFRTTCPGGCITVTSNGVECSNGTVCGGDIGCGGTCCPCTGWWGCGCHRPGGMLPPWRPPCFCPDTDDNQDCGCSGGTSGGCSCSGGTSSDSCTCSGGRPRSCRRCRG